MSFLHESPIKFHGSLCPANCLIDSRWVVKISDFGLHTFKSNNDDYTCELSEQNQGKDSRFTSKFTVYHKVKLRIAIKSS